MRILRQTALTLTSSLAAVVLCAAACGDDEPDQVLPIGEPDPPIDAGVDAPDAADPPDSAVPSDCPVACTGCAATDASGLFAWPTVPVFDFTMPPDRWQYLQDHAIDEVYEPACLSFEGESFGMVGLRFKGSYGTLYGCFDEATGEMTCPKLSMKARFDDIDPEARFYGRKRLNFHSMLHDRTRLKERLGYDLYREMGVISPRSAWAVVRINGESYGLYSMVEQVDGRFTDDRWPGNGNGNLYKEVWPNSTEADRYADKLKTNTATATHDAFIQFATDLQNAAPADLSAALGQWTDPDYLSRYMAVDDAIFNVDGVTAFYTDNPLWFTNHNSYFYQEETRDFFWLIPWDLDSTFFLQGTWARVPRWDTVPDDCSILYPVWEGGGDLGVVAPGCDRLFQALSTDLTLYRAAVNELLDGPFAEATVLADIDQHAAFIADAVADDPLGDGLTGWQTEVDRLRATIPILRQRLESLRDGVPAVPLGLTTDTVNGFDAVSDFELILGTALYSNPNSVVTRSVNVTDPLLGVQDIRIDFEFVDEAEPYKTWLDLGIPFVTSPADLRPFTGIRLWLRSNRPRTLRLNLQSAGNTLDNEGIRKGWDVPVGDVATEAQVLFADATVQPWAISDGRDPGDALDDVLATVTSLMFQPECLDRAPLGFQAPGVTDVGYLQIDAIEFF